MTGSFDDPHLLVVDDDERLRALLTRYLSSNGFRVSAAKGAAEEGRTSIKRKSLSLKSSFFIAQSMMLPSHFVASNAGGVPTIAAWISRPASRVFASRSTSLSMAISVS